MLMRNTHLICHFLNWDFGNFNVCIKIHIKVWLASKMVAELEEKINTLIFLRQYDL